MRLLPILLLLASSLLASSRPLMDDKHLVALEPRAGGFDAYWIHRNELAPVVTTRLLRTPLSLDGKIEGPAVLIREDDGWAAVGAAGPLVFHAGADRVLFVNEKAIARNVDQPDVVCGRTLCAAVWLGNGSVHAQFLDFAANAAGAPVVLPSASQLYAAAMADDDLVVVHNSVADIHATRIRRGGTVTYDALLLAPEVFGSEPPFVAISHDGTRTVFAIEETVWLETPRRLRLLAIDAQGVVAPAPTFELVGDNALGPVALVWDGARHRLITHMAFGVPVTAVANGGRIAVAWRGFRPSISIYANGEMSAPVELDEAPRRRTAGH